MNPSASCQILSASRSPKKSVFRFDWCRVGVLMLGVSLVLGATTSLASDARSGSLLTPPPRPAVAPVISRSYRGDMDGNRIDDGLEDRIDGSQAGGLRSASSMVSRNTVGVELVFSAPVTQGQIDAFLDLGGEIIYMYRAVSYGWNGRITADNVRLLPSVMGPTLVQVTRMHRVQFYMDLASQTGRARPAWKPGFAGHADGFDGDPDTTIAFIDTGVDAGHPDLAGRCVYWNDLSDANELDPVDHVGHGSLVAGVAVGTGEAAEVDPSVLTYTYVPGYSYYFYLTDPITVRFGTINLTSMAYWGFGSAALDHIRWRKGSPVYDFSYVDDYVWGESPRSLTNTFEAANRSCYVTLLISPSYDRLRDVAIVNSVSHYPRVGDGLNSFRGVAPACQWAAVALSVEDFNDFSNGLSAAVDDLVLNRKEENIKIINISAGLTDDDGRPVESVSLRDKITSAVKNGVIVVAAAGNSASADFEEERGMADPARVGSAITVGASNDDNTLTEYSTYGFVAPDPDTGEDFKPDLIAPGGSVSYSAVMSVDSGSSDGPANEDKEPDDYAGGIGTSFSSPFVAGCAALVIEAMERQGIEWDFSSDQHPLFVKMLLCATASETNADRESNRPHPTLQRSSTGPYNFPPGKDLCEGYGLINADAAVEAVSLTYRPGTLARVELGKRAIERRVWARTVRLTAGCDIDISLRNPPEGDFDLYLYSTTPSDTGTPIILASSTKTEIGDDESVSYTPDSDGAALLVVKRISGSGSFELRSAQAGPPVAQDMSVNTGLNDPVTIALKAIDDGAPSPPRKLTYTIVTLPGHGQLEGPAGDASITHVPATFEAGVDQVVYNPDPDWVGEDSFTFHATDGGTPPQGGRSNTAAVSIRVANEITVAYQVAASADDAHVWTWGTNQILSDPGLALGQHSAGMRFRDVDIPQGAQIVKATLKIRSRSDGLRVQVTTDIRAEATDDAREFDDVNRRVNSLSTTSASQPWNLRDTTWTPDTWYESPDLRQVVQEVINRSGWSPGNAIAVICTFEFTATSSREFWSYDGYPENAPRLEITYEP